ncbi:MAG: DUF6468 domain-containing protein [Acetobacteraceae bacterium]
MAGTEWLLEVGLIGLLAATLFHALRLERALGVLKRDRSELEALIKEFNESTREADAGIARLSTTAESTGRELARQTAAAGEVKDDLIFLTERAERMADRIGSAISAGRAAEPARHAPPPPRAESEAERDLLRALRMGR